MDERGQELQVPGPWPCYVHHHKVEGGVMDDATRKIVEKIAKIFQLAEKNPNKEEAAAAMAKGQEMLAAYNLDMTTIEKNSGETGKRLDEKVSGGMYRYQRELWEHIAELNFCMYWTMLVRVKEGTPQAKRGRLYTHEHRIVGRQVNCIATKNMGSYLEGVINRLCIERMGGENRSGFYSSWAVAFREGIADAVMQKVRQRRKGQQEEEQRKADEAAERAARAGISVATALTLTGVKEAEKIANYDFLNGAGAWAGKEAAREEREKRWAEIRAEEAAAQAAAEVAHAAWAKANPEEAAKQAEKERKAARKKEERRNNSYSGFRTYAGPSKAEQRKESSAYWSGRDAGKNVSIDPQTEGGAGGARRLSNG